MTNNKVVLCFGVKGQGKSYSIKRSLDQLRRHVPLYIWDPNREYAGDQAKDGIRDAIAFRNWRGFLEAAAAQQGHLGRVAVQVGRERFEAFCAFVHAAGGCTVVLDELHDYVHTAAQKTALQTILTTSRHRRIDVFAAAWRPTDLPPWARHCADEMRMFGTTESNDLRWYREAGVAEEVVIKLPRLPAKRSILWRRGMVPRPNPKEGDPC